MINLIEESDLEEKIETNKFHVNLLAERNTWWDEIYGNFPKIESYWKYNKKTFSIIVKNIIINLIQFC